MIVVDASILVNIVIRPAELESVVADLESSGSVFAPSILPAECASALWRMDRTGQITAEESRAAIDVIAAWPVTLVDPQVLMTMAWRHRHSVRIADAFYVACAEMLELPLLTSDRRLVGAATGVEIRVA